MKKVVGARILQSKQSQGREQLVAVEIKIIENVSKTELYQYLIHFTYFIGDLIRSYFDVIVDYFGEKNRKLKIIILKNATVRKEKLQIMFDSNSKTSKCDEKKRIST